MYHARYIKRLAAITVSSLMLYGCSTVPIAVCPAIVEYPPETQQKAADELAGLPKPSALGRMMTDYGQLRERLRACQ